MTPNGVMTARASMHVVHITPSYPPAWANSRLAESVAALARAQAARGHTVTVVTSNAVAPHERMPAGVSFQGDIRVIRFRNVSGVIRWWLNVSTPVGLSALVRSLLAAETIDVVHLHDLETSENLIALRVIGAIPAVVVSTHGTVAAGRSRMGRSAWNIALRARHL